MRDVIFYIVTSHDGEVVRNQLHGDDRQNSLQAVNCLWDSNRLELRITDLGVSFVADHNGPASAGNNLLKGAQCFLKRV